LVIVVIFNQFIIVLLHYQLTNYQLSIIRPLCVKDTFFAC
jgi:hypothetical protein